MQPELKAAGFDMTIKNTTPTTCSASCSRPATTRLAHLREQRHRAHAGPVLDPLHRRTSRPRPTRTRGTTRASHSIPAADTAADPVDNNLDDNVRKADADEGRRHPRRPTTSRCRSTRCPTSCIWSDKVVGPISDNPIEGMFWNIDQWGIKQ